MPRLSRRKNELSNKLDERQILLDKFTAHLFDEAGLAIGRWLEERGDLHKPIQTLERYELAGMAWAAISKYQDLREERRRELCLGGPPGDPLDPDPMDQIILGI